MPEILALVSLTFLVALIYSSVGHGGASGYLALLSFLAVPHNSMAASALCLNILVAAVAFSRFFRASHFSWEVTWPFLLGSIPFAFLGGLLNVPASVYSWILAAVLIFAAWRLICKPLREGASLEGKPSLRVSIPLGGIIGAVSGIVGIGGGIFLSPLLILFRWASAKQAAASSAFFILVNSLAGLIARATREELALPTFLIAMISTAFLGGWLGSALGAHRFSDRRLRAILSGVLFIASLKLLLPFS